MRNMKNTPNIQTFTYTYEWIYVYICYKEIMSHLQNGVLTVGNILFILNK